MSDMIKLQTIQEKSFETTRSDKWWLNPLLKFIALGGFIVYSFWAIMLDANVQHYKIEHTHYISPYFAPEVSVSWWPAGLSPALLLIWAPVAFRGTCYYARQVYYRAFLADPPACAVGELSKFKEKYHGETKGIFFINNFHRYFMYIALILAIIHLFDFFRSFQFDGTFGIGIGTIIFGFDAVFLLLYVLSCHSWKHLVGGGVDCYSCSKAGLLRFKSWSFTKKINEYHHVFFWLSLFTIILADLYVRLIGYGIISLNLDRLI